MSDFNSYQRSASSTAIYPDKYKILYPALGLAGEAGEVANKVKKIIRDGPENMPDDWREQLASEIGDVLWYCAALASDLNAPVPPTCNALNAEPQASGVTPIPTLPELSIRIFSELLV